MNYGPQPTCLRGSRNERAATSRAGECRSCSFLCHLPIDRVTVCSFVGDDYELGFSNECRYLFAGYLLPADSVKSVTH